MSFIILTYYNINSLFFPIKCKLIKIEGRQVNEAVKEGYYKSMTGFVENTIKNKLEDIKEEEIRDEISKDIL